MRADVGQYSYIRHKYDAAAGREHQASAAADARSGSMQ